VTVPTISPLSRLVHNHLQSGSRMFEGDTAAGSSDSSAGGNQDTTSSSFSGLSGALSLYFYIHAHMLITATPMNLSLTFRPCQ